MNKYDLFDSLSRIDDELVTRSNQKNKYEKKDKDMTSKSLVFKRVLPAVAMFAAVISALFGFHVLNTKPTVPNNTDSKVSSTNRTPSVNFLNYSVAQPNIPKQIQFTEDSNSKQSEDFYEQTRNRIVSNKIDKTDFAEFLNRTAGSFLSVKDNQNKIYSPANVYIALSMLASCADGETQKQILNVLGADSETKAREIATKLLKGNYIDDGTKKSLLTNSVWTSSKFNLNKSFLEELSQNYYAPVFSGNTSDEAYSKALQNWLNSSTDNLLTDAANGIKFDEQTAMALVSTLYYAANWESEFLEKENTEKVFHSPSGDKTCTFMCQRAYEEYIKEDGFSAVKKQLSGGEYMCFILPDEGVSPESIIGSERLTDILCSANSGNAVTADVKLSVPKFDVASNLNLKDYLVSLGMTDAFDFEKANYSPVSSDKLFLSKIQHAARVSIDEKGVTAAAFTVETLEGLGVIKTFVDFTLDRPFIFAITGSSGVMFIGVVNQI